MITYLAAEGVDGPATVRRVEAEAAEDHRRLGHPDVLVGQVLGHLVRRDLHRVAVRVRVRAGVGVKWQETSSAGEEVCW